MNYESPDSLYNLLPAIYRVRDSEKGYPLRTFLRSISSQVKIVKEDIDRLLNNFFIETCDDWVIPYIGDLVGNNPLHDIDQPNRADVAKTIYYRRRKGTPPMLEELARDITGWDCHVVEFFQRLDWTQNPNHIRELCKECVDVHDLNIMDLVDSPFDSVSHTIDVRTINQTEGWQNIRNIGFFLWRLQSYPLENVQARPATESNKTGCYHFSPLGNPTPLFHHPLRKEEKTRLADEINISGPIRPLAFHSDIQRSSNNGSDVLSSESIYYGNKKSLSIIEDGENGMEVQPENIICKNLENWDKPPEGKVAVDVERGRIAFADGEEPDEVIVSYYYGFSANIGGGAYERSHTLIVPEKEPWQITVRHIPKNSEEVKTIGEALGKWIEDGRPNGIIHIADSWTYKEPIQIEPHDNHWLIIQAVNNQRPTLCIDGIGNIDIIGNRQNAGLTLNGLLIEGGIHVEQDSLGRLELIHCTLVPGRGLDEEGKPVAPGSASIVIEDPNSGLEVYLDKCIVGPLRLPEGVKSLTVTDSIIDALIHSREEENSPCIAIAANDEGDKTGPPTILKRTTIFGEVKVKELSLTSEVIFVDPVVVKRRQIGCIRFSYVPPEGSETPPCYRSQPDLALSNRAKELDCKIKDLPSEEKAFILARLQPVFTSVHYGNPAYGQLSFNCAEEIKTGAEDGSEMGVFRHLRQPQREANLRIRLEEYLPFGLKPGIIYWD